ncbi:unnamed protein product [Adineta steineri]|uniref:Uncharacterized protein n=1 Tax=Adineta steineri TaxID=433720 RepID=A0A814QT05_9BILA|nr:unnamed protein product [Adineta steineri]CAF1146474.1 unnamed protein product [Adineta steineri]
MNILEISSSVWMILCSICGVTCAIVFIAIVVFHRKLHTSNIMLAFNSAVAVLIINITCGCQAIYQITSDGNDRLCSFRGFLLHAGCGLLYHTICNQALHRLFVVVFAARRYFQSKQVIVSMTIFQWLISATFGIPALVLGRIVYQPGRRIGQVGFYNHSSSKISIEI